MASLCFTFDAHAKLVDLNFLTELESTEGLEPKVVYRRTLYTTESRHDLRSGKYTQPRMKGVSRLTGRGSPGLATATQSRACFYMSTIHRLFFLGGWVGQG